MNEIEFLNIPILEWIGYIASTLVLISLSLSSMLRLRLVNLAGSLIFSVYGFLIGSYPVGIMNLIIVFFNLYYIQKLYFREDEFELVESRVEDDFIQKFVRYFKKDIQKYFPGFELQQNENRIVLLVLRNMNLAGIFIAQQKNDHLKVELDYVTPPFRDYKNGAFIFNHFRNVLKTKKHKTIIAKTEVPQQIKYLKRMGFTVDVSANNKFHYVLNI